MGLLINMVSNIEVFHCITEPAEGLSNFKLQMHMSFLYVEDTALILGQSMEMSAIVLELVTIVQS